MAQTLDGKIVIAVSSRSLFNFEEENKIFQNSGENDYKLMQLNRIDEIAKPGAAFSLVKKLLSFNSSDKLCVEVIIVSHNDPISGLRVFKSAQAHGINITRGVFSGGQAAYKYLSPLKVSLYLTANRKGVQEALKAGYPAASIYAHGSWLDAREDDILRVAFDGDGVLFGTESQRIFDEQGLQAFSDSERINSLIPLSDGPLKPFLFALHQLQIHAPKKIRIALVTARDAPSHERAIRTLMNWNIEVHEAFFLGGLNKRDFLKEFDPDIFFDDLDVNCDMASQVVPTAHVNYGVY